MNTNPSQPKLPRKRPKTQGEMHVDVQELHVEVLQLKKEKSAIEKKNIFLKQRKFELEIQLLEKGLQKDKNVVNPFECPISPIHSKF